MSKVTKSSSCVINDLNVSHQNPCDELETVAYYRVNRTHLTHIPHKGYDELVTRQNAEAIIRDLETKILDAAISDRLDDAGTPLSWQECAEIAEGIISDLKADNAAKDARIEELDRECDDIADKNNEAVRQLDRAMNGWAKLEEKYEALEADNKRLREALKNIVERFSYYAALAKDGVPNIEDWAYTEGSSDIDEARAALGEMKP